MHGLINRSIQCFVRDTYGEPVWRNAVGMADIGFDSFESMLSYSDDKTWAVLDAVSGVLGKPRAEIMEDIGTYLVTHENVGAVRRLLRFGGVNFVEFLHSLDDLYDRVRLAVPDLEIARLELRDHTPGRFSLACRWSHAGFGHVMVGVLRGMADEYGALVFLEHSGTRQDTEVITIDVAEAAFAEGRAFTLAEGHGA